MQQITNDAAQAVNADQTTAAGDSQSGVDQAAPAKDNQKAAADSAADGTTAAQPQADSDRIAPVDEGKAAQAPVTQDAAPQAAAEGKRDGASPIASEAGTKSDAKSDAKAGAKAAAKSAAKSAAKAAADYRIPADAGNGIPTVTVFVDESDQALADARALDPDNEYGTLADVLGSKRHTVRGIGGVGFVVPEGYASEYGSTKVPEGISELKYIRGRGNSTWDAEEGKRPFKIQFADKVDLFGMGTAKGWALVANAMDPTLLKNKIGYWLAQQIGLPYTPQMIPVDVVMVRTKDGVELSREYYGNYCLSELVEIEDSRLAIDKLKKGVTDVASGADPNITGGHLLSMYCVSQNEDDPKSTVFKVASGTTFINKSPEFESEDLTEGQRKQRAYIRDYVRVIDQLIMDSETIDAAAHDAIADRMDLLEAANYWWLQEVSGNGDAYRTGSTYLYKARDGKLCWGPIWDLDVAWAYTLGWADKGLRTTTMPWFDALREKDPQFVQLLRQRWSDPSTGMNAKLSELTRPGGILDTYRDMVAASWEDDRDLVVQAGKSEKRDMSLAEQVELLREWIENRRAWIDEHLDDLARVSFKVDFVADGKSVGSRMCKSNTSPDDLPEPPEREGYVFAGWVQRGTEDGDAESAQIIEDTVFEARYLAESDVVFPDRLFFDSDEAWADVNTGFHFIRLALIHQDDFIGKVKWTSSDESVARQFSDGFFDLVGTGDVIITATLHNGLSASQLLHVYDGTVTAPVCPTSADVPAEMVVEVGKMDRIAYTLNPAGKPLDEVSLDCEVDDADIVQVDCDGVVRGLKPGVTTVLLTFYHYDPDNPVSFEAVCKVRVVEAEEDSGPLGGAKREVAGDDALREADGDDAPREAAGNDALREANGGPSQVKGGVVQADVRHDAAGQGSAERPAVAAQHAKGDADETMQTPMDHALQGHAHHVSHAAVALPKTGDTASHQGALAFLTAGLASLAAGLRSRRKRS